ncbi:MULTISPECIES: DUF6320 domain-containing protein [Dehalobacter]|jgi:hypothetical protein|uniref:Zinc ribbon domain-containing protein n=2 Tax=Dehalobacter restrictus TaxID=55583 RepID=A0A857DLW6_9FIRM|nr:MULTISPECIES: DUF6320 domain-containing protein [Dehalobacter]AHF10812.1 hypothetical protein DEHRE_12645 [Dehalobacter restrictus DSM 9455]MCG1026665.1 hypothetical protein [Dehalobacter sp.]MDJ0307002.1 DUF6320 domain-containing protein [Dehalobacter sp.]OCZ54229.1 hypothetical protein A7D23_05510 [Dehalobacter sp. TeCB1]QHA01442.1 hypothetical protein GQ588_12730 [Dehalobacter restrictus]
MQYCSHCQVRIRGNKRNCPLCGNILPGHDGAYDQQEIYPVVPPFYERHLALRIMIFASVVALVVSFMVYALFPSSINWPVFALFGLISMWLSLIIVIKKRHHITKNIMWQVTILSFLSVIWDWGTGWRGWSLDFVVPILFVSAMFVLYVTAKIMKLRARDYITYFLLDGLLGIIPVIFLLFDWIHVLYPSVISVAVSIIFLSAILIFQGENIKAELAKRMHI